MPNNHLSNKPLRCQLKDGTPPFGLLRRQRITVLIHWTIQELSGEGACCYQHVQNKLFWRGKTGPVPNQQMLAMLANIIRAVGLCFFTL